MSEPLPHLLRRKAVESGLLGTGGAGKARVLMYHGIGEKDCHTVNVRHIGREVFDRHLRLYTSHFHVVPLADLIAGERHPQKLTIALTFDDGHRNNLTHALPLLEKYRVPASIFITGANRIGLRILWGDLLDLGERHTDRELVISGKRWRKNANGRYAEHAASGSLLRDHIKHAGTWAPKQELNDQLGDLIDGALQEDRPFWELMSDDELRAIAKHPLVTLGAHGWWHNDMGRIPMNEVEAELRSAKAYLEEITERDVDQLAWPDGSYSTETITSAMHMGFTTQLAVDYLNITDRDDPHILDRYGVYDFPVSDRWLMHLIAQAAA